MPVSEISKGVFIIAPRELPKYKDTAAGGYTSVFTKQRADQWEMAQKQALLNIELGTKRYAEEMKGYRDRLDALDARKKELESLKIRVADGRLDAADAAKISALREETSRQRTAADFAAKKAAVGATSGGGTSTTTGGGGRASDPSSISSKNDTELGMAKAEAPPSSPSAFAGAVRSRLDDGRLSGGTAAESDAVKYNAVNEMVEVELARQLASDPTKSYDEARADAISLVEPQLGTTDRDFFDAYERVEGKIDAADAGGGTPRVTTSTRKVEFYKKYPNLGDVPAVVPVTAPTPTSDTELQAAIDQRIKDLDTLQSGLARPSLGGTDFITDSRDIMRGRFGGFSGAPEALPFQQRNAAAELVSNQAYGLSQIEAYRDFLAQQRAEAATAGRLRESMAEGPATTSVEALRGAPLLQAEQAAAQLELTRAAGADLLQSRRPSMFDGLVAPSTPQIPERAALDIPRKPALTEPPAVSSVPIVSSPPVTPLTPPPPVPEVIPVPQADIRPEAAALMTAAEIAEFKARLQASADAAQMRRELAAVDMGGSEINPAFRTPLAPPPAPPRPALSTMSAPQQVAAPFDPQFAVPRTPAPPPPPLGVKEEGPLVVASPAMAPSTRDAAPRGPADVSAAVRPAGPLAGKLPYQIKGETERFARSTEMADDVRQATKSGLGTVGSQFGIKKGGPPTAVGYFQNRAEVALELVDKRSKLDRLAFSGPGRLAKDIYMTNSADGKPFETTWQEIQLAFAGDTSKREVAHEVALALDMINRDEKAAPKQSPK